jgi:hypothetical protein
MKEPVLAAAAAAALASVAELMEFLEETLVPVICNALHLAPYQAASSVWKGKKINSQCRKGMDWRHQLEHD